MFEQLREAIDGLDIPANGAALAAIAALRDRLDARISDAVATQDRAGLWELDGATSMTAWLTHHSRMPRARAAATTVRPHHPAQPGPGLVCSRHHHLLHHPRRHAKLHPDNTLEVTDPHGHVHTSHPPGTNRAPPRPLD